MANSPEEWFKQLPVITKFIFVSAFSATVLVEFGYLTPYSLYFDFTFVWKKFQIWRLLTSFLFLGGFGFPFVFQLILLLRYSPAYEQNPFRSGGTSTTADYAFMLMFGAAMMLVIAYFLGMPFMTSPMLFMIIYVWSRMNASQDLKFFGMFPMKAMHMPWAFVAMHLLMGNSIVGDLMGIGTGHLYYFLLEILPITHGYTLLRTPAFVSAWFENGPGGGTFSSSSGGTSTHRWGGSGHTLGTN